MMTPAQDTVSGLIDRPGPDNAITDVPGIRVGHYQRADAGYLTGTTVVHAPDRAVAGVDVSGGAPGTRETDLLDPHNRVQRVDAITLSGGSSYGLIAAHGVMQWLQEQGQGFAVGQGEGEVVPIVPGAIIFDLGRGECFTATPTAEFGYRAIAAASEKGVMQGRVGAGTGALSGSLKGGVGTASIRLASGYTVGALVVLNSRGHGVDPTTGALYAQALAVDNEFSAVSLPGVSRGTSTDETSDAMNTTIAVVATDAPLDKTWTSRMASTSQDGLARAIRPIHTLYDGDTVFALSTSHETSWLVDNNVDELDAVCQAGADTLARAVGHALQASNSPN